MEPYTIPAATRVGHVHLKVSDIKQSLDFYCGLLGFELVMMYGKLIVRTKGFTLILNQWDAFIFLSLEIRLGSQI
jgi:catechol-2,3-dioxygenase